MGHQIVKQPNGKLAIFSDGVNDWLVWDATVDEIADYYASRAAKDARDSAHRTATAVMEDRAREAYYQFTETFEHLNAVAKASGSTEGPEGPVDEATMREMAEADREFDMHMSGHLMHGSDQDAG